jgi:murein DD-endopeptidase MepM/ murein hydrolase activator NlpD
MTTTLNFYKPQKQKSGGGSISIPGSEVLGGPVPKGKMQNPMPGTARGTPFDPIGSIRGRTHLGIDLAEFLPPQKILASEAGKVIKSGPRGGYGNAVEIAHSGEWEGWGSLYAHLDSISVQTGQVVARGQVLGIEGNTGNSRGKHLHFEIYKGDQAVDPELYICPRPTDIFGEGATTPLKGQC